jgi:hypothetical protein
VLLRQAIEGVENDASHEERREVLRELVDAQQRLAALVARLVEEAAGK